MLKNSIANTERTLPCRKLFARTYSVLLERYRDILSAAGPGLMDVDMKVKDASRVVRAPGTINQNNHKICRLKFLNLNITEEEIAQIAVMHGVSEYSRGEGTVCHAFSTYGKVHDLCFL